MKPVILVAICKNEYDYIEDFVNYHLELGFDKIIIGDNNDINGELYQIILKDYIKKKQVKIINLRGKKAIQKNFYNSIIDSDIDYEWCAFIDVDEYLTFNPDSGYTNIKDFLNSRIHVNAYKVSWMIYGDNDKVYYEDDEVTERFTTPMPKDFKNAYPFPENCHCKTILRKGVKEKFIDSPHTVNYKEYYSPSGEYLGTPIPFNKTIDWDVLYIRHFFTKTIEEWIKCKMNRGYADIPTPKNNTYRLDDFFRYNKRTPEKLKLIKDYGIDYQ